MKREVARAVKVGFVPFGSHGDKGRTMKRSQPSHLPTLNANSLDFHSAGCSLFVKGLCVKERASGGCIALHCILPLLATEPSFLFEEHVPAVLPFRRCVHKTLAGLLRLPAQCSEHSCVSCQKAPAAGSAEISWWQPVITRCAKSVILSYQCNKDAT